MERQLWTTWLRTLAVAIACVGGMAQAQTWYPEDALNEVRERSVPVIRSVFADDIVPRLPPDQQARAKGIKLMFPQQGPWPLAFYAYPQSGQVHMPLTSIRFFDEIATLQAWFERHGCRAEYIQTYLYSLLRLKMDLPPPLEAFALDRAHLLADSYTNDLSGKILSSGVQFILAHEVGHLLLDHGATNTSAESQYQETEADAFALEHFARLGGNPMGIFWYFQMAWWNDPADDHGRARNTHPVSPERMRALSARLLSNPMDFTHGEADPAREAVFVQSLGQMTANFADLIEDDQMLTLMPQGMAEQFPLSGMATACQH